MSSKLLPPLRGAFFSITILLSSKQAVCPKSDPGGEGENDAHFEQGRGHGVREKGRCHQDPKGP